MSRYVNTLATDNQPGCVSLGITGVFHILKDDQVSVKETVTKTNMATAETSNPTLTFTAYASQLYKNNNATGNTFTAAEAWANAQPATT